MGVDFGLKRVGVAISDEMLLFAHPLGVVPYKDMNQVISDLIKLANRYKVGKFVVGFPRNMNGTTGEQARRSIRFARKLETKSGLPVVLWDERLTTSQAEKEMISLGMSRKRRRMTIDELSSVLILENYLFGMRKRSKKKKGQ